VDPDNRHFASLDGVLFNRNKTEIVHFPHAITGSFAIPASVTKIERGQFNRRTGLSSVDIPASVATIGNNAFDGCTWLTSINVDPNNENFASLDGVLFNKDKTALIRFPPGKRGIYSIPNTVTRIEDSAFLGSSGLREVNIPGSVTSIGSQAFSRTGLVTVTVPNSVTSLGWNAFSDNPNLVSIVLPDGLNLMAYTNGKGGGEDFFFGNASLERIIVGRGNRNYSSVDGVLFSRDGRTLVRFPQGRRGHYTIPDTVTSIGYKAFYNAVYLTSITMPASLTNIGDFAFDGCTSLFAVTIPNSVTSIGRFAFARCTGLISVSLPASLNSIGDFAFYNCINLRHFSMDQNNQYFTLANGVIFNRDKTEITQILPGVSGAHHLLAHSE